MDNGNFLVTNDSRTECKLYEMHNEFTRSQSHKHTINMVQMVFEDEYDHISVEVLMDWSCVFFAIKFV